METLPDDFQKFIKAVDKAYNKNDEDRLMLERAIDLKFPETPAGKRWTADRVGNGQRA